MNLFASHAFLDTIARVYFPSRASLIDDHVIDGHTFRLLTVDGRGPVIRHPFLDMHEPLGSSAGSASNVVRWLPHVSHGLAPVEEFKSAPDRLSGAPTTRWEHFASWDDYLELLRRRRVLRDDQRRRRRLEELAGPLTFAVNDQAADVLPTAFTWKSLQWRRMTVIDLFAQAPHREFFHQLRARGLLRASTLRAGGGLLAVWLGAVFERRWYGWIFAFNPDPALAKYSLGRQLLYRMLEESHRAGHEEFDFSTGCEPYKLFFATDVRAIGPVGEPPVRYRFERMIRECLRSAPHAYETAKALHGALRREVCRVRYGLFQRV